MSRIERLLLPALLVLVALPSAAEGMTGGDGAAAAPLSDNHEAREGQDAQRSWDAWIGCWRPVGTDAPPGDLVCVLPEDDPRSARIALFQDGTLARESVIRPDGMARPVEDSGCAGSETSFWSDDGRRVYLRTDLECGGLRRISTGVLAFVSEREWIDARAVTVSGEHSLRSLRYRPVPAGEVPGVAAASLPPSQPLRSGTARMEASVPLELADIVEASDVLAPPAVEALIAARGQGFALSGDHLVRLEEAGVPGSVIDVMVALSFPERFTVAESGPHRVAARSEDPWGRAAYAPRAYPNYACYDPFYARSMWSHRSRCFNRYGLGYGAGYGWYGGFGADPFFFGSGPVVIVVEPTAPAPPTTVVPGRGYTRGGAAAPTRTAQPRSSVGGTGPTPSATPSSSRGARPAGSVRSSGGGTTSRGLATPRATSGSSETGRRAVPRPEH